MAIGLGLMFGFHFEENFRYPYLASSISDFWRRWHISLSTWFRDYVYIPLGGNRVSHSRRLWNVFVVWLLTGIWHGANWTFILWGLGYFVLLVLEREAGLKLGHVGTMVCVVVMWVVFRCESVGESVRYIAAMFGLNGNSFYDTGFTEYLKGAWFVWGASIAGIFPAVKLFERCKLIECMYLCLIFTVSVLEIISSSYNPFIYFNF